MAKVIESKGSINPRFAIQIKKNQVADPELWEVLIESLKVDGYIDPLNVTYISVQVTEVAVAGTNEPGQTRMIFEDPITKTKPEGSAVLVERHDNTDVVTDTHGVKRRLERWTVRFCSDGFEATRFLLGDKKK